jgi:hypothetical protein
MEKDLVGLHAMVAVVKKKDEFDAEVKQHDLDRLHTTTESSSCKRSTFPCPLYSFGIITLLWLDFSLSSTVVAFNALEENKRVHDKIEAMTDLSHPKSSVWRNRSKAATVAKVEYRVEKVH